MSDDVIWSLPVLMTFMRFVWFVIVLTECDREAGQWFKSNSVLILFIVLCLVAALRSQWFKRWASFSMVLTPRTRLHQEQMRSSLGVLLYLPNSISRR